MLMTFLRPTWDQAGVAKVFRAADDLNGSPVNVGDYRLGTNFNWEVAEVNSLVEVKEALAQHAEGYVRIFGAPIEGAKQNCERKKGNFPEEGTQLLVLDIDGWKVPAGERIDIADTPGVHRIVNQLLEQKGYGFLPKYSYICMFTSSQWDVESLRCHLYFFMDEEIHLSILRHWCTATNKLGKGVLFDASMYKSVQPDYIARRVCKDFSDPMTEEQRVTMWEAEDVLPASVVMDAIHRDMNETGLSLDDPEQEEIGDNWMESLKLCAANGRGINAVAFRAAAQLVQEVGKRTILKNLSEYTHQMHSMLWEAMDENGAYVNGSRADRVHDQETYGLDRIKQYITSACGQDFAKNADILRDEVMVAIDAAADKGRIPALFDRPVIDAYNKLAAQHPGAFAEVKSVFKERLRGIVSVTDFEKAAKKGVTNQDGEQIPLGPVDGDNAFIARVLSEFELIIDEYGQRFCGWEASNGTGYNILPLDTPLATAFYAKGMEVSGAQVSNKFGKTCLQYLCGLDALAASGNEGLDIKQCTVATRVAPIGGPYSQDARTWINLGRQPDGKNMCVMVSPGGLTYTTEKECPVKWITVEGAQPICIPTDEAIEERFETVDNLKAWTLVRLFDFFNMEGDDKALFLGLVFAVLSGRGTSPFIEFTGAPSSGKSTTADLFVSLVDPACGGVNTGASRSTLSGFTIDKLVNIVSKRYLTFFDNLSVLNRVSQDAFCQVSTGVSKENRILYVGTFRKIYAKNPVVTTSLASVVTRPDLESRKTEFPCSSGKGFRISPNKLLGEWEKDRPFLFVGILHLLCEALGKYQEAPVLDGIDARRTWFNLADSYFYDTQQARDVQKSRRNRVASATMENSEFCMGICGWFQSLEDKGENSITGALTELMHIYSDWLDSVVGTEIALRTPEGEIHWNVRVTDLVVPRTSQGFTWELAKNANIIKDVAGWEVMGGDMPVIKRGGLNHRCLYKIEKEIDIEEL